MSTNRFGEIRNNQSGIASIIITLVFMVVISLVVLGFAQIANREQRLSLDRQLSSQAFFAAETGINDAVKILPTWIGANPGGKKTCLPSGGTPFSGLNVINSATDTEYSCLLINPLPAALQFSLDSASPTGQATVETLSPVDTTGTTDKLTSITFTWSNPSDTSGFSACPNSTLPHSWPATQCSAGIVRVDMVPDAAVTGRASLIANALSFILDPHPPAAEPAAGWNLVAKSQIVAATCNNATNQCSATINGLGGAIGASTDYVFHARIEALERQATVKVTGTDIHGNPVQWLDSQILIDSTGKSQNVLRRIAVWVPFTGQQSEANAAIESSQDLCKKFSVDTVTSAVTQDPSVPATCP
jgi:hypothetical protein